MKKYTKVPKREIIKEYNRLDLVICDICGKTSETDFKENGYDAYDSTIWMKTGSIYPDGGWGEETSIDICQDCFTDKLIPWVESFGGKPTVKEWDW